MAKRADENLSYYLDNKIENRMALQENLVILNQLATVMKEENPTEAPHYQALFDKHYTRLQ
jgi:hypothetical protein